MIVRMVAFEGVQPAATEAPVWMEDVKLEETKEPKENWKFGS